MRSHTTALSLCYVSLAVLDDSTIVPVALSDVVVRAAPIRPVHVGSAARWREAFPAVPA
ncbi:hypothetical protein B0H17DRAFT_1216618 [Mycena rosella]|uniref:Uncharacterized protein n=1 Tax=Mycena rosella TaxID=1033263 RepID=A0AAD7FVL2_MYCRO|nr:hypothetical protein B0H17DRAFT_1216618 [Mycena rosella]